MDFPVHVAAAACVGQLTFYAHSRFQKQNASHKSPLLIAALCVVLGVLSHLFLDAVPHYTFLFGIIRLPWVPYRLIDAWTAVALLTLTSPVFWILWRYSREYWIFLLFPLGGGVYPDIEKAAYLRGYLPRAFVLFPWHSCAYSPEGWESNHKGLIIAAEIGLFFMLLWMLFHLAQRTQQMNIRTTSKMKRVLGVLLIK